LTALCHGHPPQETADEQDNYPTPMAAAKKRVAETSRPFELKYDGFRVLAIRHG
jgi:hypothetical protein